MLIKRSAFLGASSDLHYGLIFDFLLDTNCLNSPCFNFPGLISSNKTLDKFLLTGSVRCHTWIKFI